MRQYAAVMCQVGNETSGVSCDDFSHEGYVFRKFISIVWAWMINSWGQLERDNNMNDAIYTTVHHSNLVKECFELMRMLLHCKDQGWDTMLCVTPNPKVLMIADALLAKSVASASSGIDALCG